MVRGGFTDISTLLNVYHARDYNGVATAVEQAAVDPSGSATVLLTDARALAADLTIPANVALKVIPGGLLTGPGALTVLGAFDAGSYPVFGGGLVPAFGPGACDAVRPEWFGTGAAAFQAAINAAESTGQGQARVVCQAGKVYSLGAGLTKRRSTIIDLNGATLGYTGTGVCITDASLSDPGWAPGLTCNGALTGMGGASIGLQVGSGGEFAHNCAARDLEISGFGQGVLIQSSGGQAFLDRLERCAIHSNVNEGIVCNVPGAENLMLRDCTIFNNGNTTGAAGVKWLANGGQLFLSGGSIDNNGNGTVGQVYVPSTAAVTLFLSKLHSEWTGGGTLPVTMPLLDIRSAAANPSYVHVDSVHGYISPGGGKTLPIIAIVAGELHIANSELNAPDEAAPLVVLGDGTNATVVATIAHSRLYNNGGAYVSLVSTAASCSQLGNYQNDLPTSLGPTTLQTSNRQFNTTFQDTNPASGVSVRLLGDGAVTPSKTFRVKAGALQVLNDAYSASIATLDDAGNATVAGSLGFGGNRALSRTNAGAPTLNFGTVAAQSTSELTAAVSVVQNGDWLIVEPDFAIPAGILWMGYCHANGTVTVRVANLTTAGIAVSGTFRIFTIA